MRRCWMIPMACAPVGLALLLTWSAFRADAQQALWTKHLGTPPDEGSFCAVDNEGNVYLAGTTAGDLFGTCAGRRDLFAAKYSASGIEVWHKQWGSSDDDRVAAVAVDASGHLYLVGQTNGDLYGSNAGQGDGFLVKLSPSGSVLWGRQFGTSSDDDDMASGVAVDSQNNVYVVGCTGGLLFGTTWWPDNSDAFIAKYDSAGTVLWGKQLGTSLEDNALGVAIDGEGGAYVVGETETLFNPSSASSDAYVARFDSSGALQWGHQFGSTTLDDVAYEVAFDGTAGVYVGGLEDGDNSDPREEGYVKSSGFVARYDTSGSQVWLRHITTDGDTLVSALVPGARGSVYVVGDTFGSLYLANVGGSDVFAAEYSTGGDVIWSNQFGSGEDDEAYDVGADNSGNVYVSGGTYGSLFGTNAGGSDIFLAKFEAAATHQPSPRLTLPRDMRAVNPGLCAGKGGRT